MTREISPFEPRGRIEWEPYLTGLLSWGSRKGKRCKGITRAKKILQRNATVVLPCKEYWIQKLSPWIATSRNKSLRIYIRTAASSQILSSSPPSNNTCLAVVFQYCTGFLCLRVNLSSTSTLFNMAVLAKLWKVIAVAATVVPMLVAAQQYDRTCNYLSFSGTTLSARCRTAGGQCRWTSVDLNRCLVNRNGRLTYPGQVSLLTTLIVAPGLRRLNLQGRLCRFVQELCLR